MQYGGYNGVDDGAQTRTAFREAEKRYQLFREQKMKMKRGKQKPGKLLTRPIDMSDVMDLHGRQGDSLPPEVLRHQVPDYDSSVYTFVRHPGLVYIPSALPLAQQLELTTAALTDYPEPPARTNHVLQYGPMTGLWRAAQKGLRLNWGRRDNPHADAQECAEREHTQIAPYCYPDTDGPSAFGTITTTKNNNDNGLNPGPGVGSEEPEAATGPAATRPEGSTTAAFDDGFETKKGTAAQTRSTYSCAGSPSRFQCAETRCRQSCSVNGTAISQVPFASDAGAEMQRGPGRELNGQGCGSGATASGRPRAQGEKEECNADDDDGGCSNSSRTSSVGGSRSHSDSGSDGCRGDAVDAPAFKDCWSIDGRGPPAEKLLRKLRWATLGPQFNWSQRQYDFVGVHRQLPSSLEGLAIQLAAVVENLQVAGLKVLPPAAASGGYKPDAAIVNYYQQGDVLGGHLDDVERDMAQPIISVSLGCPAIFLMGGSTKDVSPSAILLHGGDVLVLAGEARCCYHGVPRILEAHEGRNLSTKGARSHMSGSVNSYMQCARINISIRAAS
ncbi:hypothetical protein VaNZ11_004234 [Volvox africanus]|uniref:Fe2OG dioxygenase domain-containing protein n=1 Tax=Volvox africanus TaxID=51714 RepID=A0ABQ5RVV8_9CHLO|nr:hypothetical protein VaNZ11_004234 [Volvox africanus]